MASATVDHSLNTSLPCEDQAPTFRNYTTAPVGSVPARNLTLPAVDEAARHTSPSNVPGYCVDELCECSMHKCPKPIVTLPFEGDSTYRVQFKHKEVPRPKQAEPIPLPQPLPFDADSTYRTQFKKYNLEPPAISTPIQFEASKETRDFTTESRAQFCQKEIDFSSAGLVSGTGGGGTFGAGNRNGFGGAGGGGNRNVSGGSGSLPFTATSTYRTQYGAKAIPAPQIPSVIPTPVSLPFDSTSHYRDTFVRYPIPKADQRQPVPFSSPADTRDFTTAYRSAYKGSIPQICPMNQLPAASVPPHPREHSFWDPIAKKWY